MPANVNLEGDSASMDDALRAFALACRQERDRLAQQRLADADRRFEAASGAASDERAVAERLAARAIGDARR